MGFYVLCTLYEYVQLHTHIEYYPSITYKVVTIHSYQLKGFYSPKCKKVFISKI